MYSSEQNWFSILRSYESDKITICQSKTRAFSNIVQLVDYYLFWFNDIQFRIICKNLWNGKLKYMCFGFVFVSFYNLRYEMNIFLQTSKKEGILFGCILFFMYDHRFLRKIFRKRFWKLFFIWTGYTFVVYPLSPHLSRLLVWYRLFILLCYH